MDLLLYPTDGSDAACSARPTVIQLARTDAARVLVLAVVEPELFEGADDQRLVDSMDTYLHQAVALEVKELEDAGVAATGRVAAGAKAYRTILDVAADVGADMIVMGTRGMTGLRRAALGSVTDKVLTNAHVPVVVVPPGACE